VLGFGESVPGFEEKWRVGSAWVVKCYGGRLEIIVKVREQGLSLEANSYPFWFDTCHPSRYRLSALTVM
jgi:hypothetical protein